MVARSLAANLEAGGYHVSVMTSLDAFSVAVKAEQFDLFIIDYSFEGSAGGELIRVLQEDGRFNRTPIIMLVHEDVVLDDVVPYKSAVSQLVRKPFNSGKLAEEVTLLLARVVKPVNHRTTKVGKPRKNFYAVLVVEDDVTIQELLVRRLKKEGYATTEASNGLEALRKLKEREFDLVLLDIMMPEIDGFEVLRRIRGSSETKDLPVIMITALNSVDSVKECMQSGVDEYIVKPFNFADLKEKMRSSLGIVR